MSAREMLERAQSALATVDRLNRRSAVKMPLHDAMDFIDGALREMWPRWNGELAAKGKRGKRL